MCHANSEEDFLKKIDVAMIDSEDVQQLRTTENSKIE
jgi:hypothetical protein